MSVQTDESFDAALRRLLVEHVESGGRRRRAWWPTTAGLRIALVASAIAGGGGVAAATGVLRIWPPGSPVLTPLASPVTVTGEGTETIMLGTSPHGANTIDLAFRCLTSGTFTFADGSSDRCSQPDTDSSQMTARFPLATGEDSITITAGSGERWQATVFYAAETVSPWKTNAAGQTYGAINQNGTPDLVAVIGTNGKTGYVYSGQLNPPPPTSPAAALAQQAANTRGEYIPVYKSDGNTVIGQFEVAAPGADAG